MAQGHSKSRAIAMCRTSMKMSEKPMIRWVEPFAYQAGKPFRVMPLGTFKRGERTLTITKDNLQQMAANFENGRPRWKVPVYFGHPTAEQPDPPKAGNIASVEVRDDGLYAVPEYTDKGKASVEGGEYQFVSPGVLWDKNGSAYVDEQGRQFDNVIEHVALTNRPFFGQHVALFSEPGVIENMHDEAYGHGYKGHRLLEALETVSGLADSMEDVEELSGPLQTAKNALKEAMSKILALFSADGPNPDGELFQSKGHMGKSGPHAGHGGGKGSMKGGGGAAGGASKEERDKAHEEFKFLNKRMAAGNLKAGEKALLEQRMEKLAKKVLGVPENASEGLESETFAMTPKMLEKMQQMLDDMPEGEARAMRKQMMGMNLAEMEAHMRKEMGMDKMSETFAVWTTAFMNDLPDSSFLYVESGGEKDESGKTKPRSLRHFPYKDAGGKIDLPHLRNALARIPQSSLPADVKERVAAKARRLAGGTGEIEVSEKNSITSEGEKMGNDNQSQPVSAEEFAALKAKADKLDALEIEVGTLKTKAAEADTFATQLIEMKRQRRRDQLLRRAEQFVAIPEKPETIAEKLQALEEMDAARIAALPEAQRKDAPSLFTWFDGLLGTLDQAMVQADLFGQKSVAQKEQADTFEAAVEAKLTDKFAGDRAKYAEAMEAVGAERPDLAHQYTMRQRKAR